MKPDPCPSCGDPGGACDAHVKSKKDRSVSFTCSRPPSQKREDNTILAEDP